MRNYLDHDDVVHLGAPGLEEGDAFQGLIDAGWATQIATMCHPRMIVRAIVEKEATCLACLAAVPG
jgi:hypothetical protein